MSCPRHDLIREAHIGPGLEALESACFDQIIAKLAEAIRDLVLTETWSSDYATQPDIGAARRVAVAALQAEIDDPTDDQTHKVRIREQRRRHEFGQNVEHRKGCRIAHHGKIDERLDRAAPKL